MNTRLQKLALPHSLFLFCSVFFFSIFQSCDPNLHIVCSEEAKPGIYINVRNGETGYTFTDSVYAVITDGSYTETLQLFDYYGSQSVLEGAYERPGSYQVIVSADGFKDDTSQIVVTKDECHVITEIKNIELYQ